MRFLEQTKVNKKSIKGRFKTSDKLKKHFQNWDSAVHTSEKQLNPDSSIYRHRNSLVEKINLSEKEAQDYKMNVYICDDETKRQYEEYYKTHSYK